MQIKLLFYMAAGGKERDGEGERDTHLKSHFEHSEGDRERVREQDRATHLPSLHASSPCSQCLDIIALITILTTTPSTNECGMNSLGSLSLT